MVLSDLFVVLSEYVELLIYAVPIVFAVLYTSYRRRRRHESHKQQLEENIQAGLTEPASLHPIIDANLCIGCNSCAEACPEGDIIGIIDEKAQLIHPTNCIGHGACAKACPVDAITLVFGTEKRGVDIPNVDPSFETNVPGLYIAGELGGMGLIRNAIEQGRQAMDAISKRADLRRGGIDIIIIGAGPSGFAATLGAKKYGLNYLTIEQEVLGGTVAHFPRGKVVMTQPAELPIVGKVKFTETKKEILMDFWHQVEQETQVRINYHERMEKITPKPGGGFEVKTTKGVYNCQVLLLCIGRRGTPRKLGVPGEEQTKVVYRLSDPAEYRNKHVLIVGGGDSALEAATSIAEEPGSTVTLSYRSGAFSRAKPKNRTKVENAESEGKLRVLLNSNVKEIQADKVVIDQKGELIVSPNDAVIVSAGGILPTGMLKDLGVEVETKHGTT